MSWRVEQGDCVELMAAMEPASVDAVVCDPPYGLEFMGKEWDRLDRHGPASFEDTGGAPFVAHGRTSTDTFSNRPRWSTMGPRAMLAAQEWHHRWAVEALRVLKPGGHLLAFGGTRTSHRLTCALEDAGFEIRDTICWLYGSGFPKSLDVGKAIDKQAGAERVAVGTYTHPDGRSRAWADHNAEAQGYHEWHGTARSITAPATPEAQQWDGWGTALKPAHEPIVMARKPLAGTVAGNVLEHGTGALNVDGCRVDSIVLDSDRRTSPQSSGSDRVYSDGWPARGGGERHHQNGRWPANLLLDQEAAAMLDEQSGERHSAGIYERKIFGPREGPASIPLEGSPGLYADSGGASRFFYVAKASRAERNAGLDGFEEKPRPGAFDDDAYEWKEPRGHVVARPSRNHHPTVKPVNLMRWLCRLVTPPGGLILDPFTGSGTTGIAAVLEGFDFLGCEQDADYAAIAEARVGWWELHGHDALRIVAEAEAAENERQAIRDSGQLDLLTEG